jgi:crossover junction endodeoxyribonuclease RuvC
VIFCGIDPGNEGGIARIDSEGRILALDPMPVIKGGRTELDGQAIRAILAVVDAVYLERVNAMKGWGAGSSWRFGSGWGLVQGIAVGLGVPLELVLPKRWQRSILGGESNDKGRAIAWVKRRWPDVDLAPGRRTKPHDGLADALCLAEFGRRLNLHSLEATNGDDALRRTERGERSGTQEGAGGGLAREELAAT